MSYGLEVFAASGALLFNTDSTLGRIVAYGTVTWAAGVSGSIVVTVTGLVATDRIMASGTNFVAGGGSTIYTPFTYSVSGTSVTFFRESGFSSTALSVYYTAVRMQ